MVVYLVHRGSISLVLMSPEMSAVRGWSGNRTDPSNLGCGWSGPCWIGTACTIHSLLTHHSRSSCSPPSAPIPERSRTRSRPSGAAKRGAGKRSLFNGRILSLDTYEATCLSVRPTDYRHFFAGLQIPNLRPILHIRPLAITGIVCCRDGVVLGRRGAHLAQGAGRWEPVPAGGLEQPDPDAQLLRELEEELGIGPDRVTHRRPVALVEDGATDVHDIVFVLDIALDASAVIDAHESARPQGA